jgi:anti-anti-sigma factor
VSWVTHQTDRFTLSCHRRRIASYITLEGRLDVHVVNIANTALREALADGPITVVVDLGKLEHIDSSGLAFLVRAKTNIESRSGRMFISRHSQPSRKIIEETGLTEWFAPTDGYGNELVPCPICDEEISPLTRTCDYCGGAL